MHANVLNDNDYRKNTFFKVLEYPIGPINNPGVLPLSEMGPLMRNRIFLYICKFSADFKDLHVKPYRISRMSRPVQMGS